MSEWMEKLIAPDSPDTIAEDAMLKAVAQYLERKGWQVAVIGASRVQGPIDLACNYELVFRFTGRKREGPQPGTVGDLLQRIDRRQKQK